MTDLDASGNVFFFASLSCTHDDKFIDCLARVDLEFAGCLFMPRFGSPWNQ